MPRLLNFEKLNKSLVPLSNLAVLVGVVLLIVELRQNQEILELEYKMALLEASHLDVARFTDWRQGLISNPDVADIFIRGSAGEELGPVDRFRFVSICNDLFRAGLWGTNEAWHCVETYTNKRRSSGEHRFYNNRALPAAGRNFATYTCCGDTMTSSKA